MAEKSRGHGVATEALQGLSSKAHIGYPVSISKPSAIAGLFRFLALEIRSPALGRASR